MAGPATIEAPPAGVRATPRMETVSMSHSRRDRTGGHELAAEPTPLFTRHMLGAIEAERDERRRRRGRSGIGRTSRRAPLARVVHPRLTVALAGVAATSTGSVPIESSTGDRWADDGGSFHAPSSRPRRVIANLRS